MTSTYVLVFDWCIKLETLNIAHEENVRQFEKIRLTPLFLLILL